MNDPVSLLGELLPEAFIQVSNLKPEVFSQTLQVARYFRDRSHDSSWRPSGEKVSATAFFQSSTRTLLSFHSATYRLGGHVVHVGPDTMTRGSDYYGETVRHLLLHLQEYADILILRHFENIGYKLTRGLEVPLINAGDGYGEHPTQALGDVLTMLDVFGGSLSGRSIGILGSTRLRTVRSLVRAIELCSEAQLLVYSGPEELGFDLPQNRSIDIQFCDSVIDLVSRSDVVYVSGFDHPDFSQSFVPPRTHSQAPVLSYSDLEAARATPYIMHPGPRSHDLDERLEEIPQNLSWSQVRNCLYVRMALLAGYFSSTPYQRRPHL